jgi:hypothetical protein
MTPQFFMTNHPVTEIGLADAAQPFARGSAPTASLPFTFVQVSPPKARPSRFAFFTQSGETKVMRRKALNAIRVRTQGKGVAA